MYSQRLRSWVLPVALTLSCLCGGMLLGVPGLRIPLASAYVIPPCSNTACSGYDRCTYWSGIGCSFSGSYSCTSTKC